MWECSNNIPNEMSTDEILTAWDELMDTVDDFKCVINNRLEALGYDFGESGNDNWSSEIRQLLDFNDFLYSV